MFLFVWLLACLLVVVVVVVVVCCFLGVVVCVFGFSMFVHFCLNKIDSHIVIINITNKHRRKTKKKERKKKSPMLT